MKLRKPKQNCQTISKLFREQTGNCTANNKFTRFKFLKAKQMIQPKEVQLE